jgi:hypothetical protein
VGHEDGDDASEEDRADVVLQVLRACLSDSMITKHAAVLQSAPMIAAAVVAGDSVSEATASAVRNVIATFPSVERRAFEVWCGLAPGWESSRGISREDRKNEMSRVLFHGEGAEPNQSLTVRRVEQLQKTEFAPQIARRLFNTDLKVTTRRGSFRDRAIFAQFINPEFLTLHSQADLLRNPDAAKRRLAYCTRMAILTSRIGLILPASYLFEVPGVAEFMSEVRELSEVGAIQLAAPASGLDEYRENKVNEYRDESTSNPYLNAELVERVDRVTWRPRHGSTAAQSIADAWAAETRQGAILGGVVRAVADSEDVSLRIANRKIARVPERMDGRALVSKYVFNVIGTPLPTPEKQAVRWLLSNKYLESYLDDLDAAVLVDFEFGSFSTAGSGPRREISASRLTQVFRLLSIEDLVTRTSGGWSEILAIRDSIEFDILLRALYDEATAAEWWLDALAFRRRTAAPSPIDSVDSYISWLGELVSRLN